MSFSPLPLPILSSSSPHLYVLAVFIALLFSFSPFCLSTVFYLPLCPFSFSPSRLSLPLRFFLSFLTAAAVSIFLNEAAVQQSIPG